jgi:hypothetical protein
VTPNQSAARSRFGTTQIALLLGAATLMIALLTPEPAGKSEGGLSTFSTAPGGAGIAYELARRFGWRTERRITPLDSVPTQGEMKPTVQVVLAPREQLGAHEIHNLLQNVRRGGGLVFSVDDDALADSIGVASEGRASYYMLVNAPVGADTTTETDSACSSPRQSRVLGDRLAIPPEVGKLTWKRHAPGRVVPLVYGRWMAPSATRPGRGGLNTTVGLGFPLGKGRVAAIGGSDVFSNDAVQTCRFGADLAVMQLLEYVRRPSTNEPPTVLVFDEFHHGFGVHGGSLTASATYLARTRSGHLLAQALIAGLILLLALAPRPLVPRDDTHVVRRSPLEHAAALGRAYEDVAATRTATTSLLGGLRRRTRGIVPVPASAGDDEFLAGVVRRIPSLAPTVDVVKHARSTEIPKRDFAAVGQALASIEEQLQTSPHPSTRS